MNGLLQRWVLVQLVAAPVAAACWFFLPGSVDRATFSLTARGFGGSPQIITGEGSRTKPWQLQTLAPEARIDPKRAPLIVALDDDKEGIFQSKPPSPIDVAVILNNLQRLGAKKAATAAVLAWDAPDPIGLTALEKTLGRFDSLVMAAPLGRGAVAQPLPKAFRKASLPVHAVHGDITLLPVVNRVPLQGLILGGENTWAGFQTLDAESETKLPPLLARWDDRVVFAFPLLAAMQGLGLQLDGIEIRLGEYLKLGPQGPAVPLDPFGRLAIPLGRMPPMAEISAAAAIDGGDHLFPKQVPAPVILRDDQSAVESATRAFSSSVATTTAAIASGAGFTSPQPFQRLTMRREIIALSLLIAALQLISLLPRFPRNSTLILLAVGSLTAHAVAASFSLWLPTWPALAAIVIVFTGCLFPLFARSNAA